MSQQEFAALQAEHHKEQHAQKKGGEGSEQGEGAERAQVVHAGAVAGGRSSGAAADAVQVGVGAVQVRGRGNAARECLPGFQLRLCAIADNYVLLAPLLPSFCQYTALDRALTSCLLPAKDSCPAQMKLLAARRWAQAAAIRPLVPPCGWV